MGDFKKDCKQCICYRTDINKCDGFTYICDCLDHDFCPMYETEEMIKFRKSIMPNCKILKVEE